MLDAPNRLMAAPGDASNASLLFITFSLLSVRPETLLTDTAFTQYAPGASVILRWDDTSAREILRANDRQSMTGMFAAPIDPETVREL